MHWLVGWLVSWLSDENYSTMGLEWFYLLVCIQVEDDCNCLHKALCTDRTGAGHVLLDALDSMTIER